MLQLVPFLVHNQGLHISEVAARFGITRKALEDDLRILICSGLPEGYPDDLLDIQWDDDHVFITQALDLTRPVRFTVDEACALLTGLETLNGLPELAEGGALESVTLKLMAAAGEEGVKAAALSGPEVAPGDSAILDTARAAIESGAQLHLRYFSPQRDAVSERDVDPLRLYSLDNTWYLEAYCHSAQGLRNFRLDRIEALEPNGRPAAATAKPADSFPVKLFTPNDDDTVVVVELAPRGTGLADDYYAERTAALPGGGMLAEIRFGSTDWLPMFVAQHGGMVRILQPEALAAASREWLAAALTQYEALLGSPDRLISMPWWSWIVIWIALVALSLLFFGVLGFRLFRQATTTLTELGEAADRFSTLPSPAGTGTVSAAGSTAAGAGDPGSADESLRPVPGDAIFASPARMRHDYHASKLARQKRPPAAPHPTQEGPRATPGAARHRNALDIGCIQTKGPLPMRLEGWHLIIIIVLALVLFAAPKLPGMARSLGQSMRIFKSEVREMKKDGTTDAKDGSEPVEGRVINHPQAGAPESRTGDGTDVPPSTRA